MAENKSEKEENGSDDEGGNQAPEEEAEDSNIDLGAMGILSERPTEID